MPEKLKHNIYYRSSNIQIRKDENGNETKTIFGTIPFNSDSLLISDWWDEYIEQIAPTAFNKTLADRSEVKAFVNRDDGEIIGSSNAGTLRMHTEEDGLHFEVDVPNTTVGNDAWETIKRGDCTTLSFGFIPVNYTETIEKDEDGTKFIRRTLTEVKLLEISVCVAFPAYPEGSTNARSIFSKSGTTFEEFAEILKRSENLSDEDKTKLTAIAEHLLTLTRSAESSQPGQTTDENTAQKEAEEKAKAEAEQKAKEEANQRARWAYFNQHIGE